MITETISPKTSVSPVIRQTHPTMKPPMDTSHAPDLQYVGINWSLLCDEYVCRECGRRTLVALMPG